MPSRLKEVKKCKHCDRPAKKNIMSSGRDKGYLKTCGNRECLLHRYSESENIKKRAKKHATCLHCNKAYKRDSARQKWCKNCVPDIFARRIYTRYGLTHSEYTRLLSEQPICPICRNRKATVVDHCHSSGRVRGILCNHCNMSLNLIENKDALHRAVKYLNNKLNTAECHLSAKHSNEPHLVAI